MYESKTAWLEAVLEKRRSQNKITTETNQKMHKSRYEFVSFCYMIEV